MHKRIIRASMDDKERQLFTLMWSLLNKYQTLLGDALPVIHEVVSVIGGGNVPSDEQLQAWDSKRHAFDQRLHEVTANLESLRLIADPLFRYDA
jgi:hypothetical protein